MNIEQAFDSIDDVIDQHVAKEPPRRVDEKDVIDVDTSEARQEPAEPKTALNKRKKLIIALATIGLVAVAGGVFMAIQGGGGEPLPSELVAAPTPPAGQAGEQVVANVPSGAPAADPASNVGSVNSQQAPEAAGPSVVAVPVAPAAPAVSTIDANAGNAVTPPAPAAPVQTAPVQTAPVAQQSQPQNPDAQQQIAALRSELERIRAELAATKAHTNTASKEASREVRQARPTRQASSASVAKSAKQADQPTKAGDSRQEQEHRIGNAIVLRDGVVIQEGGVERSYGVGEATPYGVITAVNHVEGVFVTEKGTWKTK